MPFPADIWLRKSRHVRTLPQVNRYDAVGFEPGLPYAEIRPIWIPLSD